MRCDLVNVALYEFCCDLVAVPEEVAFVPTVVGSDSVSGELEVVCGVTVNNDVSVRGDTCVGFNYEVVLIGCANCFDFNYLTVEEVESYELVEETVELVGEVCLVSAVLVVLVVLVDIE